MKVVLGTLGGLMVLFMLFLSAVFGGTIVWYIWPYAMNAFPGVVKSGYLAPELSWGSSIALTYLCAILFKSSVSKSND